MINWYKHNDIKKSESGNRVYETYLPVEIKRTEEDIYIISVRGDRLDLLAQQYYSDISKWRIIAAANNLGKGTLAIEPGLQIRIPIDTDTILKELNTQNENR